MGKINDALRASDIYATLVNSYQESKPLGKATEIRNGKLRFNIPKDDEHISPFNYFVLHTERKVVAALNITPIFVKGVTSVQIRYQD